MEAFGLFSTGHIEDLELVQTNKPGRNKVAVFNHRGLEEPFEKLKQTFTVAIKLSDSKQPLPFDNKRCFF